MQQTFTIQEFPVPWVFRVVILAIGIHAVGLGLFAIVQRGVNVVRAIFADQPMPPDLAFILFVFLCCGAIGVFCIWVFLIPMKTVVIDASTQKVHLTLVYPFWIRREVVFPLAKLGPPDVTWQRNSDYSENGYWLLKVPLPNGRVVKRVPNDSKAVDQKLQAEAWKAEIQALRH